MSRLKMVSRCKDLSICPKGDCIGCWDSKLWCLDPRCHPHCNGCAVSEPIEPYTPDEVQPHDTGKTPTDSTDSWKLVITGFIFFVLVILGILFIWFMWSKYGTQTETLQPHVVAPHVVAQSYQPHQVTVGSAATTHSEYSGTPTSRYPVQYVAPTLTSGELPSVLGSTNGISNSSSYRAGGENRSTLGDPFNLTPSASFQSRSTSPIIGVSSTVPSSSSVLGQGGVIRGFE